MYLAGNNGNRDGASHDDAAPLILSLWQKDVKGGMKKLVTEFLGSLSRERDVSSGSSLRSVQANEGSRTRSREQTSDELVGDLGWRASRSYEWVASRYTYLLRERYVRVDLENIIRALLLLLSDSQVLSWEAITSSYCAP